VQFNYLPDDSPADFKFFRLSGMAHRNFSEDLPIAPLLLKTENVNRFKILRDIPLLMTLSLTNKMPFIITQIHQC
jgi:hypothetical protein